MLYIIGARSWAEWEQWKDRITFIAGDGDLAEGVSLVDVDDRDSALMDALRAEFTVEPAKAGLYGDASGQDWLVTDPREYPVSLAGNDETARVGYEYVF